MDAGYWSEINANRCGDLGIDASIGTNRNDRIKYVTPYQRHHISADTIGVVRWSTHEKADRLHPARWSCHQRCWKQT